ncbi:MAG: amidohydrolase family protein [Verrucomicrobia bacterium]|nr:amidohydrolase family protein [Verrucomicrobiota bacterium]
MHQPVVLQNCRLVFPDFIAPGSLRLNRGRIEQVRLDVAAADGDAEVVDCAGDFVGPGFVDIHNHGAAGVDFIDGDIEGIESALAWHQRQGSTSVLATLLTHPPDMIEAAIHRHLEGEKGAEIPANFAGIHIEGPYLNPVKKGMHREDWMHDPLPAEYQSWVRAGEGRVRILTAAPERDGSLEMYAWLRSKGIVGSFGHTTMTWERAQLAAAAGASHFVHVNNAMEWPTRATNAEGWMQTHARGIGSFLSTDVFTGEIIGDGWHVTPELVRVLVSAKGLDRIALVSDASPLTGLAPGNYTVATVDVELRPGRLCMIADGSGLASSVCSLLDIVRNLVRWGFPLLSAWRMASWSPARIAGWSDRGILQVNSRADLVRLDSQLALKGVWQGGKPVART